MTFNAELLTVIIRIHSDKFLSDLDQCLFSVAYQGYRAIEAIVCTQNFGDNGLAAVEKLAKDYRISGLAVTVVNCELGAGDHRAEMLNVGLSHASGRYIAFLDHDDCVYNGGYSFLINRLRDSKNAPVAFGRVARSDVSGRGVDAYCHSKSPMYTEEDKYSFFLSNIYPIHSSVLDRKRIREEDMYFDKGVKLYEDYMFYMRILSKCDWEDCRTEIVAGEYRIHLDGSNTVSTSQQEEKVAASKVVEALRNSLNITLPLSGFCDVLQKGNSSVQISSKDTMQNYAKELLDTTSWRAMRPFRILCAKLGNQTYKEPVVPDRESEAEQLVLKILTSSSWALSYPIRVIGRVLRK
ncbi:glycosyltransferase family A protein [Brucella anthropi]|uniref:glycosyltransferase family A protein n=1 Tax=Brucella anthropi TaxID=529 RepID=UPI000F661DE9|nr:glycosyltransferase family A protein [Brucella anthropi]RRY06296.1 glycosyltransferase family 2 protein [Brucella anthropi]